jgi:molecular chaperone DnaK
VLVKFLSTVLIGKNTTVPTAKTQVFSTAADSQPSVEIHVLQGERPLAQDNKTLGRFMLDGIPVAPRGTPQIEVSFDIDANGILSVSAKDKATNKTQSIKIEGSSGLSKEEVEKMKKDAELHAAEDKKKQENIETKNLADAMVYTSEKTLKDNEAKIQADVKKEAETKISALKESQKSDNIDDIKAKTKELSELMQKIGTELYKQNPQGTSNNKDEPKAEGPDAGGNEPKAEEGEYKEK